MVVGGRSDGLRIVGQIPGQAGTIQQTGKGLIIDSLRHNTVAVGLLRLHIGQPDQVELLFAGKIADLG